MKVELKKTLAIRVFFNRKRGTSPLPFHTFGTIKNYTYEYIGSSATMQFEIFYLKVSQKVVLLDLFYVVSKLNYSTKLIVIKFEPSSRYDLL